MNCWCNKQLIGLVIGLILPVLFRFVLFKGRYHGDLDFGGFLVGLLDLHSLGKLVSISVMPNLLVFFIAIWTERLLAARGIVFATLLYTVGTVILWFLR
jgi:hypothetical protein